MRQTPVMRLPLLLLVLLAGCPHPRGAAKPVAGNPEVTPGADLEGVGAGSAGTDEELPDPRRGDVTDLDVIHSAVVGRDEHGDPIFETTTPGPLLDKGNEAFAAGKLEDAIRWYRQLADEFPDSKLAPAALFNI